MTCYLSDLAAGDVARVSGYRDNSGFSNRLMSLGLIPGTVLTVKRFAPLGDPVEIRFRGFSLALRPSEARALELERV